MAEYDNTNKGSIWKNEKKETEKHPDFTGSLNVEGVEYWVSGWKRKEGAHDKAPALSFSVKRKEDKQRPSPTAKKSSGDAFSDDVPFLDPYKFNSLMV